MRGNGTAITRLRQEAGLTKTQLARVTGMDVTHLHRIEKGERKGTPAQLVTLARYFRVPLTDVAIDIEEPVA